MGESSSGCGRSASGGGSSACRWPGIARSGWWPKTPAGSVRHGNLTDSPEGNQACVGRNRIREREHDAAIVWQEAEQQGFGTYALGA
jgi:hypothetical protein